MGEMSKAVQKHNQKLVLLKVMTGGKAGMRSYWLIINTKSQGKRYWLFNSIENWWEEQLAQKMGRKEKNEH